MAVHLLNVPRHQLFDIVDLGKAVVAPAKNGTQIAFHFVQNLPALFRHAYLEVGNLVIVELNIVYHVQLFTQIPLVKFIDRHFYLITFLNIIFHDQVKQAIEFMEQNAFLVDVSCRERKFVHFNVLHQLL